MDQQPPQVVIAASTDPEERRLPAGGVLPRDQSEPGGHVPCRTELFAVAGGGENGTAQQWNECVETLTERFPEDDALIDRQRRLTVTGLYVLPPRSVRSELDLTRNAQIDGIAIAEPFVYVVPTITAGATTRPLIDRSESISIADAVATIEQHFETLFEALVAGAKADDFGTLVVDAFVTFEPWFADGARSAGEGTHVTGWRGGGLARDADKMQRSLGGETKAWLEAHRPPGWPGAGARATIVINLRILTAFQKTKFTRARANAFYGFAVARYRSA